VIIVAWNPRTFFPLGESSVEGIVPLHWQASVVSADIENAVNGFLQHIRIVGIIFAFTLDPKLGVNVTELVGTEVLRHVVHANLLQKMVSNQCLGYIFSEQNVPGPGKRTACRIVS
jgi:hypothetical protein